MSTTLAPPPAGPSVDASAPRTASAAPSLPIVLSALGGLGLLGTAAGLGTGLLSTALRTAPSGVLIAGGAVLLTSPGLLVVHQLLSLKAPPEQLVTEVARGAVRLGQLAAGLTPFVLFFAITSGLSPVMYAVAFTLACLLAALTTVQGLVRIEREHAGSIAQASPMLALAAGWVGLTSLVALRLAFAVFS